MNNIQQNPLQMKWQEGNGEVNKKENNSKDDNWRRRESFT